MTLSQPSPTTSKPEGHDTELESDDSDDSNGIPRDSSAEISGSKPSTSSAGHKNSFRGGSNPRPSLGHEKGKRRPILESFEQFMNEEDFTVDSGSPNPRGRSSSEISFTRVRRIRRPLNDH